MPPGMMRSTCQGCSIAYRASRERAALRSTTTDPRRSPRHTSRARRATPPCLRMRETGVQSSKPCARATWRVLDHRGGEPGNSRRQLDAGEMENAGVTLRVAFDAVAVGIQLVGEHHRSDRALDAVTVQVVAVDRERAVGVLEPRPVVEAEADIPPFGIASVVDLEWRVRRGGDGCGRRSDLRLRGGWLLRGRRPGVSLPGRGGSGGRLACGWLSCRQLRG